MKKLLQERIASIKDRRSQLDMRLATLEAKAKAQARKQDTRRKIVVGAAVLVEMERMPRFAAYVREMLGRAVTRPQDIDAIADLLQGAMVQTDLMSPPAPSPSQDIEPIAFQVETTEKLAG